MLHNEYLQYMQLQTTPAESKFPNEYSGVIFIQIDQHLKKLLQKHKGVPILWKTVYVPGEPKKWHPCQLDVNTMPHKLQNTCYLYCVNNFNICC